MLSSRDIDILRGAKIEEKLKLKSVKELLEGIVVKDRYNWAWLRPEIIWLILHTNVWQHCNETSFKKL